MSFSQKQSMSVIYAANVSKINSSFAITSSPMKKPKSGVKPVKWKSTSWWLSDMTRRNSRQSLTLIASIVTKTSNANITWSVIRKDSTRKENFRARCVKKTFLRNISFLNIVRSIKVMGGSNARSAISRRLRTFP